MLTKLAHSRWRLLRFPQNLRESEVAMNIFAALDETATIVVLTSSVQNQPETIELANGQPSLNSTTVHQQQQDESAPYSAVFLVTARPIFQVFAKFHL